MTTYVAFLRGVNLGRGRKVSMGRLADVARDLGYDDVWTWVNSGNLVLRAADPAGDVEVALSGALEHELGLRVDVTVRSAEELAALLEHRPFRDAPPAQVTVTFLLAPAPDGVVDRLAAVATAAEPFVVSGREVWVRFGEGQARSRLAAGLSGVLGVSATTRTLGTVSRIVARLTAGTGSTTAGRERPAV